MLEDIIKTHFVFAEAHVYNSARRHYQNTFIFADAQVYNSARRTLSKHILYLQRRMYITVLEDIIKTPLIFAEAHVNNSARRHYQNIFYICRGAGI